MTKVHERSRKCEKFYQDRVMMRAIRGGTESMRAAGEKYLPREAAESPTAYKRRLARSTFANFVEESVRVLASKPFSKPVIISSDRYPEIAADYAKRADGRGTSITTLSAQAFDEAMWQGTTFIAVDAPESGGRPYAYLLKADNILDYDHDEDGLLTYLRISEKISVRDGGFDSKEVGRVREFKRDGAAVSWDLWQEDDAGEYASVSSGNPFPLEEIPVVGVHAGMLGSDEFFAAPPLTNLMYQNIQHWQESSDQSHILHVAKVPLLFMKGGDQPDSTDGKPAIAIGSEYAIQQSSGEADMKWVEITGSSINAGRQSIVDLESRMMRTGLEMLANGGAVETATGRSLRAGENNNRIAQLAANLEAALEKVFFWLGKFNMISEPDFGVSVHKDYGINASTEELNSLIQARTLGDLSREDFLTELVRRSILRPEFNKDDNLDRLSSELV